VTNEVPEIDAKYNIFKLKFVFSICWLKTYNDGFLNRLIYDILNCLNCTKHNEAKLVIRRYDA
jgi:hypothetical protein